MAVLQLYGLSSKKWLCWSFSQSNLFCVVSFQYFSVFCKICSFLRWDWNMFFWFDLIMINKQLLSSHIIDYHFTYMAKTWFKHLYKYLKIVLKLTTTKHSWKSQCFCIKITLFSLNKWLIACVLVLIFLQLYDTI
jgi:hypothetical protein